ncbi:hypothetical protein BDW68DRAFT_180520 [Aspergillus falconensis]
MASVRPQILLSVAHRFYLDDAYSSLFNGLCASAIIKHAKTASELLAFTSFC